MGQSSSNAASHSSSAPHATDPASCNTDSASRGASPASSSSGPSTSGAHPSSGLPTAGALADTASTQLRENLEALHHQLMQHAGADFDIATATTLSYTQFISYITQLNDICRLYQDDDGRVLVFAVKKGTDSSIFWKATVRIACVKYHTKTRATESHRLLTIRQFLQVFRRITYECTAGSLGAPPSPSHASGATGGQPMHPTTAASVVLGEMSGSGTPSDPPSQLTESSGATGGDGGKVVPAEELEECVICLERRPEVILPCAHAYCLPCIQQWWEYSSEGPPPDWRCGALLTVMPGSEMERTCPVCREAVTNTDDTWVISEAPDDAQVTHEISMALMGLAGSSAPSRAPEGGARGGHLSRRTANWDSLVPWRPTNLPLPRLRTLCYAVTCVGTTAWAIRAEVVRRVWLVLSTLPDAGVPWRRPSTDADGGQQRTQQEEREPSDEPEWTFEEASGHCRHKICIKYCFQCTYLFNTIFGLWLGAHIHTLCCRYQNTVTNFILEMNCWMMLVVIVNLCFSIYTSICDIGQGGS